MTMEKGDKKRSLLFWKKSHSQSALETPTSSTPSIASSTGDSSLEVTLEPDAGAAEFAERDVNFSSVFMPFVKNYVSNLSHHKNPTKLPYPPNFYYPSSSLQHQMNLQLQYADLLVQANSFQTPVERFLAVLKYSLSTCSLTKFPYKPIISFVGETAQTFTKHASGDSIDTTYYVAEQVDREPPTSAFYISNPAHGVVHEGFVALTPKFKQAHVQVTFVGQRKTVLTHPQGLWNETYVGDVPDLMIRLLRMHTELGGSINLNCEATGISASVHFKDKPIFGGVKNAITGRITMQGREIYHIDGTWDEIVYLTDATTKARVEFLNRSILRKSKVESTYPLDQQPETSGEREWGPLLDSLHRQDFEQSKIIKAQLDARHQERLARFEVTPFVTSFFHKTAYGTWEINDPSLVNGVGGKPTM